MSLERVKRLLTEREGIRLEFKESRTDLPGNLFETICAMLNREGGDILLGISDDRSIKGIEPTRVESIKTNLVSLSNNPTKLDPPFILFPKVYEIEGALIIHLQVPESSQLHKSASSVYDRSNDGDFKVTQPQQIAEIYNRKRTHYTEGIVYPALRFEDFKPELFPKVRNLIRSNNPSHPWLSVDDQTMLKMAGLWKRDIQTNQEGYTLAAALLFGKDEVIQSILPHYKIDALLRRENTLRYDDREYIQTNLIDAYDQLMSFVGKHLPDKFYMEGDQRVSLRSKIFREVVANLIVHREYLNAHPATFVIHKDRVETENANNPHGEGPIDPNNFAPFPKNPTIAKFFIQLGRVEELGSGVLNVTRLLDQYSPGKKSVFFEGATFKTILPLDERLTNTGGNDGVGDDAVKRIDDAVNDAVSDAVSDAVKRRLKLELLKILETGSLALDDLKQQFQIERATAQRDMKFLRDADLIEFVGPPKTGKYVLTARAKKMLKQPVL